MELYARIRGTVIIDRLSRREAAQRFGANRKERFGEKIRRFIFSATETCLLSQIICA